MNAKEMGFEREEFEAIAIAVANLAEESSDDVVPMIFITKRLAGLFSPPVAQEKVDKMVALGFLEAVTESNGRKGFSLTDKGLKLLSESDGSGSDSDSTSVSSDGEEIIVASAVEKWSRIFDEEPVRVFLAEHQFANTMELANHLSRSTVADSFAQHGIKIEFTLEQAIYEILPVIVRRPERFLFKRARAVPSDDQTEGNGKEEKVEKEIMPVLIKVDSEKEQAVKAWSHFQKTKTAQDLLDAGFATAKQILEESFVCGGLSKFLYKHCHIKGSPGKALTDLEPILVKYRDELPPIQKIEFPEWKKRRNVDRTDRTKSEKTEQTSGLKVKVVEAEQIISFHLDADAFAALCKARVIDAAGKIIMAMDRIFPKDPDQLAEFLREVKDRSSVVEGLDLDKDEAVQKAGGFSPPERQIVLAAQAIISFCKIMFQKN